MTELKYLHAVHKLTDGMREALEEVPRRGGMYNWMFLFKGSIAPYNSVEDYEKYDVVQVNCSPVDQLIVREVRKRIPKSSSTLLVLNNDYVVESWDTWEQHPLVYKQVLEEGDAVFGTEEHQTSFLGKNAYTIPHPHWIKMLKRLGNDDCELESSRVAALYHWWEGKSHNSYMLFDKLREKYPKLWTSVYGYTPTQDRLRYWNKTIFDETEPLMSYPKFIQSLQRERFVFEPCSFHTYGRTSVDTAALRIPTMGSERVDSMKRCWKETSADPWDIKKQYQIADKLLSDDKWLQERLDYAYEACEYYNYDNAKARYLNMVEDVRRKLGK